SILAARAQQFLSLSAALEKSAGVNEVGRGQAEPAQLTDSHAESQVGVAGQRRQKISRWQSQMTNGNRCRLGRQPRHALPALRARLISLHLSSHHYLPRVPSLLLPNS